MAATGCTFILTRPHSTDHGWMALLARALETNLIRYGEDAEVHLAYLVQGGLGLPERSYYLGEDERSTALRGAPMAGVPRSHPTKTKWSSRGGSSHSAASTVWTAIPSRWTWQRCRSGW